MLNIGDDIQVGDKQGTIILKTKIEDRNYIFVVFEEKKYDFKIYEYKIDNDKLLVGIVEDVEETKEVLEQVLNENLDDFEFPKELNELYDKIIEKLSNE